MLNIRKYQRTSDIGTAPIQPPFFRASAKRRVRNKELDVTM
jgi:hypothetical protein